MEAYHLEFADLLLRLFTGTLFFFQGYDKLFRLKLPTVIDTFMNDAERHQVPKYMVSVMAYFTSIAEFSGGILLILGLWTSYAICLLGVDLVLVCFAFSFLKPMWELKHVFPRFILIILLLVLPLKQTLCLDYLISLVR